MRRELVPIEHLGVAADALGKGRDVPDFAFSGGTREVRNAATAFHTMRIRLRRSIQQRTEMLAGVSHDLRTPLTRMKLSLALLPEFARDQGARRRRRRHGAHDRGLPRLRPRRGRRGADRRPTSPRSSRTWRPARGATTPMSRSTWQGDMNVELRPLAIKRCLTNLVSNALRYGTMVQLQAVRGRTSVEITDRRRRAGHSARQVRGRVPAVLPARRIAQRRYRRRRPRPHHRPRRGAQPWRRRGARRLAAGRPAGGRENSDLRGGRLEPEPPVLQ